MAKETTGEQFNGWVKVFSALAEEVKNGLQDPEVMPDAIVRLIVESNPQALSHTPTEYVPKADCEIMVRGEEMDLTPMEFRLLHFLLSAPNNFATFEDIYEHLWGEPVPDNKDKWPGTKLPEKAARSSCFRDIKV